MKIRNVMRIVMRNYVLVFKTLAYKLVTFVLFSVAMALTLKIRLRGLYEVVRPVINDVINVIKDLFTQEAENRVLTSGLNTHFNDLLNYLSGNVGNMVITATIAFILIFLYRYFSEISDAVAMLSLDYHMSSLTKKPYFAILFENLKTIALYGLVEVAFALVYAVAVGAASYGLASLLWKVIPVLVPCFLLAFILSCQGLYNTMTSQFMAQALLEKKGIRAALVGGFRPQNGYFGKMYMSYTLVNLVIYYLIVTSAVFTFGVATLFLIPFAAVVVAGMKTIDYYIIKTRKYFIDYDNIVVPKELRENDEQLLKDVDI